MIFAESMTIGGATWKISDEILEIYDPMEEEYLEMTVDFDALENGTLILNMDGDELVLYKDE